MKQFTASFEVLLKDFQATDEFEAQSEVFEQINKMRQEYSTMYNLCHIRHTINTQDTFYEEENSFFDTNNPNMDALVNKFYRLLLNSPFRQELEKRWGSQLFIIAELTLKTFRPSILEKLQKENLLTSQYVKIKAGAKIEFEGKEYNFASILPLERSEDREVRRRSSEVRWQFYADKSPEIEQIYDEQVKTRHQIAQDLGFGNFVELGYARMLRSDYNATMVANFRRQVLEHIVPLATDLYKRQAKRLGMESLKYYDENFRFASGNPKPKGDPKWIINNASKMYKELSPDTQEFF